MAAPSPRFTTCLFVLALTAGLTAQIGTARGDEVLVCPDLSNTRVVGTCESEAQLRHLFRATCGRAQAPEAEKPALCDSLEGFRQRKWNALWESSDGEFMGYLPCELDTAILGTSAAVEIRTSKRGRQMKVSCIYENGRVLAHRRKGSCRIPGAPEGKRGQQADCSDKPDTCRAVCE